MVLPDGSRRVEKPNTKAMSGRVDGWGPGHLLWGGILCTYGFFSGTAQ